MTEHGLKNEQFVEFEGVLYVDHRSITLRLWPFHLRMDPFPRSFKKRERAEPENVNLTHSQIEAKRKEMELQRLQLELKRLKGVEAQYQRIMQCIDNQNGFLLADELPILPDLDYVPSTSTTSRLHTE